MEAMIKLKLEGTNDISKEFLQDFYNSPELGLVDFINKRAYEVWQDMLNEFKTAQKKVGFAKISIQRLSFI
jgi:hypothetical protein